jgi:poly-beta-1,6-N-acetyl-D-glucosamine synthase
VTVSALYVVLIFGVGTLFWASVGVLRFLFDRARRPSGRHRVGHGPNLGAADVAVVIAARNEAAVIAESIDAAAAIVPRENIFIVSDASTDPTADISRAADVNVLELEVNAGKAGAIVAGLQHFDLYRRFEVVMFMDADTRPSPDYLTTGLPAFRDRDVVAVAGYAKSMDDPLPAQWIGRLLVAYRQRFYTVLQLLFKYGQAAGALNVVSIVPGFASMYRTSIVSEIDISAPGLVIEDFNMTFEVHAKKLGRIAHHPGMAVAYTQDPENFREYVRQIRRWTLGFWQTVRRHGFHAGVFWWALAAHIFELILSALLLVFLIPLFVISVYGSTHSGFSDSFSRFAFDVSVFLPPESIALGVYLPDFVLTVITVVALRRSSLLLWAPLFPLLRIVDAGVCLSTLPLAWSGSSGRWTSPTRRKLQIQAST